MRHLVRNVVELMHSTVMPGDFPVVLPCDMAAAFLSVSRRWMRTVLECLGVPLSAIRIVEAVISVILLLLNMCGVITVGLVRSGIAQGCPLSGVVFVCATEPIGRRLHSAPALASAAAGRFAGVKLKPAKCNLVLVGTRRGEVEREEVWGRLSGMQHRRVPRHVHRAALVEEELGGPFSKSRAGAHELARGCAG